MPAICFVVFEHLAAMCAGMAKRVIDLTFARFFSLNPIASASDCLVNL
jgi:hypothetical protein